MLNVRCRFASQVHVHQQIGIDIDTTDVQSWTTQPCVLHKGCANLPLQWFQCQPVVSKRLARMIVQVENDTCITVVWTGDIWEYRGALFEAGVTSLLHMLND